ncbi:tail assembly protein [Enterobacter roggenkampii]|uniref:tail assembly protein n=1 Tax=Enterobacter roggenkampii TaxID=1812935 RepID=UPI0021D01191|nr:tail assembly protein [Enterobacter roggenkampii]MCU6164870.1 tail assembly protein [Enterobacter roggenkampii]
MKKTLILKGRMAKKFGKTHQFHVADLREMLRAMCSQVPGFRKYMNEAHINGIRFAFFSGRNNIGIDEFDMTAGGEVFTIEPVFEGAKRGGFLQVVIGAAALAAAFFTAGGSLALWGAAIGATTATGVAVTALTSIGLSMVLGGVVQMLTPQPDFNVGASSSSDNKPNYAFGAPVNTVSMGYPVPLLYGEREIGGAIISAGMFSSDQQ